MGGDEGKTSGKEGGVARGVVGQQEGRQHVFGGQWVDAEVLKMIGGNYDIV